MEDEKNSFKRAGFRERIALVFFLFFSLIVLAGFVSAQSAPTGPDSIAVSANETKGTTAALVLNVSGGRIATINISATVQNVRWKAFLGEVTGTFTLDDSTSSTIYDWSMTTVAGEVYATTNITAINWTGIKCANKTLLENENSVMGHVSADDNITKTFNDTTHAEFFIGAINITVNTCPTLNTYKNNASQNTDFEEMVLTDSQNLSLGGNLVYTTIIETNVAGFDSNTYDFQMIVPERGTQGYSGVTAYYLYVELN